MGQRGVALQERRTTLPWPALSPNHSCHPCRYIHPFQVCPRPVLID